MSVHKEDTHNKVAEFYWVKFRGDWFPAYRFPVSWNVFGRSMIRDEELDEIGPKICPPHTPL